ncbi:MAG: hypothetical protein QF503_02460 [Rhodospirillales bacterium]|nr:hypothetical protein [Rhodospirillales bacterium]
MAESDTRIDPNVHLASSKSKSQIGTAGEDHAGAEFFWSARTNARN